MVAKILQHDETKLIFDDTTTAAHTFTVNNLAAGAGRQSDLLDLGTGARAHRFAWRAYCQFATNPVVPEAVRVYIKTSDGSKPDNDDGVTDAAVSAEDKLNNLYQIGSIIVDEAATGVIMASSGLVILPQQWVGVVFWNATADNLVATDNLNGFSLTPVPFESQ